VAACQDKHDVFDQKKKRYWSELITTEGDSPTKLWRSLTLLLQRDKRLADDVTLTCNDADAFMRFFEDKVKAVPAAMNGPQPPSTTSVTDASLPTLLPCSDDEVSRLIMQSTTKSCTFDPILTFLLKELVDALLPYVTAMVNASLHEGRLPPSQKHAVFTPLQKNPGLDADDLKNYWPVSNLTFTSKLVEKAVALRLTS